MEGQDHPPAGGHERYGLLDGMRGVAAIAVVLYHLGWQVGLEPVLFPHAYLAVDFFFMLSGFVLADAYDRRLARNAMTLSAFSKARLIRLMPMIVLGMVIGLVIRLALIASGLVQDTVPAAFLAFAAGLVLEPFLVKAGAVEFRFPLNEPLWSLFWEMVANVVYAIVTRLASQTVTTWRIWSAASLVFALLLVPFALTHNGLDRGHHEVLGGFLRVGFAFFIGVLMWQNKSVLQKVTLPVGVQLAALVLVLANPRWPHVNAIFDLLSTLIVFPIVITSASKIKLVGRSASLAAWMGAISYPLYALHNPFMAVIEVGQRHLALGKTSALGAVVLIAVLMIAASHVVLRSVDEPVRAWLRAVLAQRAVPRAQTAP